MPTTGALKRFRGLKVFSPMIKTLPIVWYYQSQILRKRPDETVPSFLDFHFLKGTPHWMLPVFASFLGYFLILIWTCGTLFLHYAGHIVVHSTHSRTCRKTAVDTLVSSDAVEGQHTEPLCRMIVSRYVYEKIYSKKETKQRVIFKQDGIRERPFNTTEEFCLWHEVEKRENPSGSYRSQIERVYIQTRFPSGW